MKCKCGVRNAAGMIANGRYVTLFPEESWRETNWQTVTDNTYPDPDY